MNIALCDDEPEQLAALDHLVAEYSQKRGLPLVISTFNGGEELLAAVGKGQTFDIIFLDIYMGSSDGISVARKIRESDTSCAIIFATNSRDHAINGYAVRALQYLLKPLSQENLESAMDQALESSKRGKDRLIQVNNRQGSHGLPLGDIIYAESDARVVTIHTLSHGDISIYGRLDDFERSCDDSRFLRCHKSYLVNMDHVRSIAGSSAILESGREIRISMGISKAKELFATHVAGKI